MDTWSVSLIPVFLALFVSAEVKSVSIDVSKEEVLVESSLTSAELKSLIENTGRRAVLKGIGGSEQGEGMPPPRDVLTFLRIKYFLTHPDSFLNDPTARVRAAGVFAYLRGPTNGLNNAFLSS